jgi:hypothetical protein
MRISLILTGAGLLAAAGAAQAQRIPPGHLPSPGQCRVWYPDRPPGHQPPPTSCRAAERQADRYGGRVIYGGRGGPVDDWSPRDDRRFYRWALRNFDYNRDGRLNRRELRLAQQAWDRRY